VEGQIRCRRQALVAVSDVDPLGEAQDDSDRVKLAVLDRLSLDRPRRVAAPGAAAPHLSLPRVPSAAGGPYGRPIRRSTRVTLAVLTLDAVAYALLQSSVTPAVPHIQGALEASPTAAAWVITAFLLTAAIATPIAGRLGDLHGKQRVLTFTLALMVAGTLLAAVSRSLVVLVAARAIQGVGGGVFPLAFGIVADELAPQRVSSGIGWISAMLGVGTTIGIVVSGPIVAELGYAGLFWISLGPLAIAALATAVLIPPSPARAGGSVHWGAAALLCAGLAAGLLAITDAPDQGWLAASTVTLFAVAAALLAAWSRTELRARSPLVDMRMLRRRAVWTTNAAGLLLAVGMFCAFILIPQLAVLPRGRGAGLGLGQSSAGLLLVPTAAMMLVTGVAMGALERRVGLRATLIAGAALSVLAFVLLSAAHAHTWEIAIAALVAGLGIGLSFAAMPSLIVAVVDPAQTGVATGMNTVTRWVGGAFGSQVAASILAASAGADGLATDGGFTTAFALTAAVLAIATLAALAVPRAPALA
jgi:MFS family permease